MDLLDVPSYLICFSYLQFRQTIIFSSESKDTPLGLLLEQEYSNNFFPAVSMTRTLYSVMYAPFLPQNDEQIKGLSPNLTYGRSELIEKSLQRNEAKILLAEKNLSVIFAFPITVFFNLNSFSFNKLCTQAFYFVLDN